MKKSLIITLIFIFSTAHLMAGWKIILHQNTDGVQEVVTYYISKSGMKISTSEFDFIYFKTANTVIVVNHKIKSIFSGSFKEYQQQLKDLMSINPAQADKVLPKSNLLRFDQFLAKRISDLQNDNMRTSTSLTVNNTNLQKRIAEYDATEYKIIFDTVLVQRLWLSQDISINNDFDILEAFNFFRGIEKTTLSQSKNMNTQEYEQLLYHGFPLKTTFLDDMGFEIFKSEAVQIQEVELYEEDMFSLPKDYQEKSLIDLILAQD